MVLLRVVVVVVVVVGVVGRYESKVSVGTDRRGSWGGAVSEVEGGGSGTWRVAEVHRRVASARVLPFYIP